MRTSTHFTALLLLLTASSVIGAPSPADCVAIRDDPERLRCYDAAHGRSPAPDRAPAGPLVDRPDPKRLAGLRERSIWEQRILDDADRPTFTLTTYRPSYLLLTRTGSPNPGAAGSGRLRPDEVKLHVSLHTKVADDIFPDNGDLWIAYGQTSWWQAFNDVISNPFRETVHEPEVYLSFLTDVRLPGLRLRNVNVGYVHQSNGQSRPLSRSWDRVFAELQMVRGGLGVTLRPWVRIPEDAPDDDNPDIEDYLGHYELRVSYERKRHLFGVMLRNAFDRRYNAELSWSYPIAGRLRLLLQWYRGYGESLIDYNHSQHRIGLGLLMSDWL